MQKKILYNGEYPIYVIHKEGELSSVETELAKLKAHKNTMRHLAKFEVLMERFTSGEVLPSDSYHLSGKYRNYNVYEFISKPYRLYCIPIPNGRGAVLLSHSILKKWQKTKDSDKLKAVKSIEAFIRTNE